MINKEPIDVFIGYSKADTHFLELLRKQLTAVERIGLVDAWHDGEIEVGSNREEAIKKAMNDSEIIILLISADFIASEFNYEKEMKWAMEFHERKKATVIPVILKDCTWKYAPFAHLDVLPRGGIPVTDEHWKTIDRAFKQVVEEVVKMSKRLRGEPIEGSISVHLTLETPQEDKKKRGFFNLKTGLIALGIILALVLAGTQMINWENSDKASIETNLTNNEQAASKKNEVATKEIPVKKQNPPQTQVDKKEPEPVKELDTPAKQSTSFEEGATGERINDSSNSDTKKKTGSLEILPDPEPPTPEPKQYLINGQTMTDLRDQKTYQLTKINGRWWMAENLKTNIQDAYCPDNCTKIGRFYNHQLALKVCPKGWRLPTRDEWKALTATHISTLNLSATLSGTKYRLQHLQAGQMGYYWSSTVSNSDESWAFQISQSGNYAADRRYKHQGMHCRCVLD